MKRKDRNNDLANKISCLFCLIALIVSPIGKAEYSPYLDHGYPDSVYELRNGVIAITEQPNNGPKLKLTKDAWSPLISGEKRLAANENV